MEKAAETLASKSQVDTTFNIADKKRAKTKKISEEGIKPPDTSDKSCSKTKFHPECKNSSRI